MQGCITAHFNWNTSQQKLKPQAHPYKQDYTHMYILQPPCAICNRTYPGSPSAQNTHLSISHSKSRLQYTAEPMPAAFACSHPETAGSRHYHEKSILEMAGNGGLSARVGCSCIARGDSVHVHVAVPQSFRHRLAPALLQSS